MPDDDSTSVAVVPTVAEADAGAVAATGGSPQKKQRAAEPRALPSSLLNPVISSQILSDNQQLVFDQLIYSPMFMRFVYNVLTAVTAQSTRADLASTPDALYLRSLPVLQWAISFTLQVLAHFQDNSLLGDYINCIIAVCKLSPPSCAWLVDVSATDPSFALSVVVTASDKTVRTHVARLLVEAMDVVIRLEAPYVLDTEDASSAAGVVSSRPRSSVARLLTTLFSLIPGMLWAVAVLSYFA
jgi:hypothetical protein